MVETTGGGPQDGAAEVLDRPLPDGVRRRVVQIVADGFGGLTVAELPAQLRQYARFTPTRRAKFAGNAMAAALETDPLFRQRIGEKLRETEPELTGALDSGSPPPAADPLDVAAAAYVLRPPGWVKLVTAAGEEAQRADAERADEETRAELERLRAELDRARDHTRAETERLRAELDAAKKETDSLHRKLRSALADVKRGEAALRKLRGEMEAVRAEGQTQVSAAESETRRLKARLGRPRPRWRPPAAPPARAAASRTCAYGCCSTPCWTPPRGCAANWHCRPCPYGPRRPWTPWSRAG